TVDQTLLERTDGPPPYNSLHTFPADGTVLYAVDSWQDEPLDPDTSLYQVQDGYATPTTADALAARTDSFSYVPVDRQTLDRAGDGGRAIARSSPCTTISWAIRRRQKPAVASHGHQVGAGSCGGSWSSRSCSRRQPVANQPSRSPSPGERRSRTGRRPVVIQS